MRHGPRYDLVLGVVYFSNPMVRLKLGLSGTNSNVVSGEKELNRFISEYNTNKKISSDDVDEIVTILRKMLQ